MTIHTPWGDLPEPGDPGCSRFDEDFLSLITELARVAYHEAGHVVAAHLRGRSINKVSIEPSGRYLGVSLTGRWLDDEYLETLR